MNQAFATGSLKKGESYIVTAATLEISDQSGQVKQVLPVADIERIQRFLSTLTIRAKRHAQTLTGATREDAIRLETALRTVREQGALIGSVTALQETSNDGEFAGQDRAHAATAVPEDGSRSIAQRDLSPAEPILKKEQLNAGWGFTKKKGWLVLTPSRLYFSTDKNGHLVTGAVEFDIPVTVIENARPKKAFRAGVEVLEVHYRTPSGKTEKCTFERISWAQWANRNGRLEANSLTGWEQVLNEIRIGRFAGAPLNQTLQVHQPAPVSAADELVKWADLRDRGIITDAEFADKKRELLSRM